MSAVCQVILNLVDYGQGMQGAISAPRLHAEGAATEISARYPAAVLEELTRLGHQLVRREDSLAEMHFARPNGILVDPDTGRLHGGVFQFSPATAVGVE